MKASAFFVFVVVVVVAEAARGRGRGGVARDGGRDLLNATSAAKSAKKSRQFGQLGQQFDSVTGGQFNTDVDASHSSYYENLPGISLFKVVTFPNDPCNTGSSRNGTCYTAEECKERGGSSSGSCAKGYGVCCVFTLSCGGECKENCTYIDQPPTAVAPTAEGQSGNACIYTVCKCADNICRIRFDFDTFLLAGPQTDRVVSATAAAASTSGGGIGDCVTDQFSVSSPGNVGSPVICGFNTGQHMIVDASEECNKAFFSIGSSSEVREWNIKVTQYRCGDELGGPDSCLQFYTGESGIVSSFNFPTTDSTVGADTTHLSSQDYDLCFRREEGRCAICYVTAITQDPATADAQSSYGLGVSGSADSATAVVGTSCSSDYLAIPNAEGAPVTVGSVTGSFSRLCGRVLSAQAAATQVGTSVCSQSKPFRLHFFADASETTTTAGEAGTGVADSNEVSVAPGGIVGFSLRYEQVECST